jgi:hypothetical protein
LGGPLQHRHVERLKLQGSQIRIEPLQVIFIIGEALLIGELLEMAHDASLSFGRRYCVEPLNQVS